MSTLRTRPPTGKVAYPLVLLEGEEKAGKSFAAYSLSSSPKVGRTFVFDLGEGTADEYAQLGPYEVIDHNGTFTDLLDQLRAACALPPHEGRPNVVIIDDASALWALLKDWASARARQSKAGRRAIAADPDAEVDVAMNLWNDAKDRWDQVINLLRTWPGIGVVIAKGREVSKVAGGVPVAGQTEWSVDVQKTTPGAVSAWVRMRRPHTATLVGVRSLHVEVPSGGLTLPAEHPLEHLVFGVLGAEDGFAESTRTLPSLADMTPEERGEPEDVDGRARALGWGHAEEQAAAWRAVLEGLDPVVLRRLKAWKAEHARGQSREAWEATRSASLWFSAHRQAEVDGEDPFTTRVEDGVASQEALHAYATHLAHLAQPAESPQEPPGPPTPQVPPPGAQEETPPPDPVNVDAPTPLGELPLEPPPPAAPDLDALAGTVRAAVKPDLTDQATQGQRGKIHGILASWGIIERPDRLAALERLIGHPFTTSSELTRGEASAIIESAPPPQKPDPVDTGDPDFDLIVARVRAMTDAAVKSALKAAGKPAGSNPRVALAEHLLAELGGGIVKDAP